MTDQPATQRAFVDDQHRYRFESRIATGGMGEVWRATDTSLGRPVAVKVLKSEYADDPLFRSRFETEARHAASLHHPGVASVYDVGESALLGAADGSGLPRPFLVMELVDGQPLSALLRGGRPLDPEVVRDLMAQAADAIGAAHRAGIVHRDVKPANLLVTPDRQIKITDFGIARASDGLGLTATGQVMGTPQYLSPEQARGATATPASDVYSLGVVAFECLAGHRPFDADSPVATALAHLNDPVPDLPPDIPADLAAVVRRAMAKDAGQRYADGDAFAVALRDPAAAAGTAAAYVPRAAGVRAHPGAAPCRRSRRRCPHPTPVAEPAPARRRPAQAWPIVLLVLALVAAIVLIIVVATQANDDDDDPTATDSQHARRRRPRRPPRTRPTEETSSAPAEVQINEDDYLGRNVDEVAAELRDKGLEVDTQPIDNPGDEDADTVASVRPTSGLVEGDTVTVEFFREAEPTSEPPTTEPTSEPPPTSRPPRPRRPRRPRRHPTPRTPRPRRRPPRPRPRPRPQDRRSTMSETPPEPPVTRRPTRPAATPPGGGPGGRALRARRAARPRRHGRGPQGPRHPARPRGRDQAAAHRPGQRRDVPGSVPPRGPERGLAQPPGDRGRLRHRRGAGVRRQRRLAALHRHGVRRRPDPARHPARGPQDPARAGPGDHQRRAVRARLQPPRRDHPPRHQARQRDAHARAATSR